MVAGTPREDARYVLDRRTFRENALRDVGLLLVMVVLLRVPLLELLIIYLVDALLRSVEVAGRARLARGRPRGTVQPFMFTNGKPVDSSDPRAVAGFMLVMSLAFHGVAGAMLLIGIHGAYGGEGVNPLRAVAFSALYTVPFLVYEHRRWVREKSHLVGPHILARDLSFTLPFASVFAMLFLGPVLGVVSFVVLRAWHDSLDVLPVYSMDGRTWLDEWPGDEPAKPGR